MAAVGQSDNCPPEDVLHAVGHSIVATAEAEGEPTVLLATAVVRVPIGNKIHECRAMCDSGAQINLISKACVQKLRAKVTECNRLVAGIGNPNGVEAAGSVELRIQSRHNAAAELSSSFTVMNELDIRIPRDPIRRLNIPEGLKLADDNYHVPADVDMIFGAEIWAACMRADSRRNEDGTLLQDTMFGYIVLGRCETALEQAFWTYAMHVSQQPNENRLAEIMKQFWEQQEVQLEKQRTPQEELAEKMFRETYYRNEDGRYVVKIPILPDAELLGDSREIALRRFHWLEKRLDRNPELRVKYVEFMREYEALNHMQMAGPEVKEGGVRYYIPHHCVTKKFRVVFDASCKTTNGKSLNDVQAVGEKLQMDLVDILMRFRRHAVVVTSDIRKMFRQVRIDPEHWDLQRIFWRNHRGEPIREYQLTVVTYGLASSVHSSVRAMQQCATDNESKWPRGAYAVKNDFYVDDCFTGADDPLEAILIAKEIEAVLLDGGFELAAWKSNDRSVLQYLQGADGALNLCDDSETKILGITWLSDTDELTFRVNRGDVAKILTKAEVLSEIAKLYDPMGFLSPIIVRAKLIMQDLWRSGINWKQRMPSEMVDEWNEFYDSLERLTEVRIPRWIGSKEQAVVQLHGFADASNKAFGAVVYARATQPDGIVYCRLLTSKSRVAPIKSTMTTPRLELAAAELLASLMTRIMGTIELPNVQCYYWSDSTIVLHWLRKEPRDLMVFVSNRVASIQQKTEVNAWAHVRSEDNPADLLSRGMKMNDFLKSELWFHGPKWLTAEAEQWPKWKEPISADMKKEVEKEMTKTVRMAYSALESREGSIIFRCSNWMTAMRATAYVFRFVENIRRQLRGEARKTVMLSALEIRRAISHWAKVVQKEHYPQEIKQRRLRQPLPANSKIAGLNPQLRRGGVLCVGGRLANAELPDEQEHQIIIPPQSRLGWLLLNWAHQETLHGGVQQMMRFIRTEFWIPRLRQEASLFVARCAICARLAKRTESQLMADLPAERVRPTRAFLNTGVDYAGPFDIKRRPGRPPMVTRKGTIATQEHVPTDKGYVAVFVCLATRAVHLEPVMGLTSEAFIAAYTRFVSRRGFCETMISDNGTNFVGADRELKEALISWQEDGTVEFMRAKGTEWKFITPSAPFKGGIWEAAVKSMKFHLRRVMRTQVYTFEMIATLLAQVEACMNSRPLCALSDDPDDARALTPGHFLIGEELINPPAVQREMPKETLRSFWQQTHASSLEFWKEWSIDYLRTLQTRKKWKIEHKNIAVGQLVLVRNENAPPTHWALGRVTEVHPGQDGLVRTVTLLINGDHYVRPVQKLCTIPTDSELDIWN